MITVDTELGTIKVAKNVIGNIIMDVIDSFDRKVYLSNSKGRISKQLTKKLGAKDEYEELGIELTEDGLNLQVYVVLRFGTSIKGTTGKMINDIRTSVKETTGMDVNELTVTITGMLSKHIAPRNIEVRG